MEYMYNRFTATFFIMGHMGIEQNIPESTVVKNGQLFLKCLHSDQDYRNFQLIGTMGMVDRWITKLFEGNMYVVKQ